MELGLGGIEMHRLGHLFFRVAARAGVNHGQAGGDAVGREKEIAVIGFEAGIKVQRKGGVAATTELVLAASVETGIERSAVIIAVKVKPKRRRYFMIFDCAVFSLIS